jgi:hypothetical protein
MSRFRNQFTFLSLRRGMHCVALVGIVVAATGCSQGPGGESVESLSAALSTLPAPTGVESHPTSTTANGEISLAWDAVPGADSYNIYRSKSAGGEGTTPIASSTTNSYLDTGLVSGAKSPVYYYKVAAVNASGTSPQSEETATPTPLPVSKGSGTVPGVNNVYYCKDGLVGGFDWFVSLNGWFPSILGSSNALTPGGQVVDMAYAQEASLTFSNVQVATAGLYNVDIRYAFSTGLFGGVDNREMGLAVNGVTVTSTMRFPVTGSFSTYRDSSLQVNLNAGTNAIVLFNVSPHGISRADTMTISPATASAPSAPSGLSGTSPIKGKVALSWTAAAGSPTGYNIYRSTDGMDKEEDTPYATVNGATTTYTDPAAPSGKILFYNVAASNAVGVGPDSNQISVTAL